MFKILKAPNAEALEKQVNAFVSGPEGTGNIVTVVSMVGTMDGSIIICLSVVPD